MEHSQNDTIECPKCKKPAGLYGLTSFGVCNNCLIDYEPELPDLASKVKWLQYLVDTNRGSSTNEMRISGAALSLGMEPRHIFRLAVIKITVSDDESLYTATVRLRRMQGVHYNEPPFRTFPIKFRDVPQLDGVIDCILDSGVDAATELMPTSPRFIMKFKVDSGDFFTRPAKSGDSFYIRNEDFDKLFVPAIANTSLNTLAEVVAHLRNESDDQCE